MLSHVSRHHKKKIACTVSAAVMATEIPPFSGRFIEPRAPPVVAENGFVAPIVPDSAHFPEEITAVSS
jgi:hypothetical protein